MFLCRHNLMDYSLLLFVEQNENYKPQMALRKLTTLDRSRKDTALNKVGSSSSSISSQKQSLGSEKEFISNEDEKNFFNIVR